MATNILDTDIDPTSSSIDKEWSCPKCTYTNSASNSAVCQICETINPQCLEKLFITDHSRLIWECRQCTLNNEITDNKCKICRAPKSQIDAQETTPINSSANTHGASISLAVRERRHQHEIEAENIFKNIVKYCKERNVQFVDDQFRPTQKSIGSGSFRNFDQWLRISKVTPFSNEDRKLPWTIFSSPQASDIEQGALGNCWLVAVIALICEQPRLLEHILLTKEINSEGVYLVRICQNGLWKPIIVDDFFPCTKHKHLLFTQAKRRQLYVPLIEKACAKIFGSYSNLRSGTMYEGLQLLTGASCDYIDLTSSSLDANIIWVKLLSACESKLLIGVSSGGTKISHEEYTRVHINDNHAFSILTACTLSANDVVGNSRQFVLVRDPHSRSWYREESITDSVLEKLRSINSTRRSTGAFWISWSQFLRYFSSITISTYNKNHFDIREQGTFTRSPTESIVSYRLNVPEKSLVNISLLHHRYDRTTRATHTQGFVLCDVDERSTTRTVGKRECILVCKSGRFSYWSGLLQAGSHVLIPFSTSFWKTNLENRNYTIVIHSSIQLNMNARNKPATFLADCLIATVTKNYVSKHRDKDVNFYKTPSKLGLQIFIAENHSMKNHLIIDINVKTAKNVRHSRYLNHSCNTHDCIPPRHRQILLFSEWMNKHDGESQLAYTYQHYHDKQITKPNPPIDISRGDIHSPRAF